jgi:hypothetical protein
MAAAQNFKGVESSTAKDPGRLSRNQISEYLAQRRKGIKKKILSELGALKRLGEINIRIRICSFRKICAGCANFER